MNSDQSYRVFTFEDRFIENYRDILVSFSSENDPFSISDKHSIEKVVDSLKTYFECSSVLIYQYGSSDNSIRIIKETFPPIETNVENLLKGEIRSEIPRLLASGDYSGSSFNLYRNEKQNVYVEVDLIPLPNTESSRRKKSHTYLFVLVDPVNLKTLANHAAERDFQRALIANFLQGWWIKIVTRRTLEDSQPSAPLPSWYSIATLPELVDAGYESAKHLRHSAIRDGSLLKELYFQEELTGRLFEWERWSPRMPFSLFRLTAAQKRKYKDLSKLMIYFCRWTHAHRELETEKSDTFSRNLTGTNDVLSVDEWVKRQRIDNKSYISAKLNDLFNLASNSFGCGQTDLTSIVAENTNGKLIIGKTSLLAFSLSKWLEPNGALHKDLESTKYSDVEFCRVLHGLATIAHYLFVEEKEKEPGEIVHRLMQFVSRYGHNELGIPSRLDFRSHLLHTARGEPALHALKPFYRDHFMHALEVCFLGQVLLETRIDNRQYLWQIVGNQIGVVNDKRRVLKLWYVTSLLHDIGYTMDVLDSSRKYLEFFRHSRALNQLQIDIDKAITELAKEEEVSELGIEMESGMEHDHGLIGALHLSSLLKRIQRDDPSIDMREYKHAIQAIALHNLRRPKDRISFSNKPLAFLLAICDQIQEWRRIRLPYSTSPLWLISKLNHDYVEEDELDGMAISMKSNLLISRERKGTIDISIPKNRKNSTELELTLEYDDKINRNGSVFNLWLDAALNFQRLDFDGLPINIYVKYKTPYYYDRNRRTRVKQLHRLRDAYYETHMDFLSDWFPTDNAAGDLKRIANSAINHYSDDHHKVEELSIDLKELSKKMLISRDLRAFWQHIREWKHFNDDRDFPGDYASFDPE